MQRRLIAAIAAVILAGIGAILLFNYVATADARAMAGQSPTDVLVVTDEIPVGTLGSQISGFVEKRQLPASAVANGALASVDEIASLAATTNLLVGEQIIRGRFAAPGTSANGEVAVDDNKQLVTVSLEPQRVLGGKLAAGNKVAVYVTYDEKTQEILKEAKIVRIGSGDATGLITLELVPADAQRLILATEVGKVWLALDAKNPAGTSPLAVKELVR
jgi:pilus assembly protein CpaB